MRRAFIAIMILGAAVVSLEPAHAAAQETGGPHEGFSHLTVEVQDLGPGESRHHNLTSDEGEFRAGWVFILYGGVQGNASVVVNLTHEGRPVDQWTWETGGFHKNSTRLHDTGAHELSLWNPSTSNRTQYAFYYDQSCNCAGKTIPLPGGFVLFNYDLPKGRHAFVGFPSIPGWALAGAVARLRNDTAVWPNDFQVITQGSVEGRGWLNLTWTTTQTTRYYVFVEAPRGASVEHPVDLTPLVEATKAATPGFTVGPIMAAALAVFLSLKRGRRE